MKAYLGNAELKEKTVSAMNEDIVAERVVKGHYWNKNTKNGCFVGCVIRGDNHGKFETKLGIPRILARLGDGIFEGLQYDEAKKFTVDFLEAIQPGADLSSVWPKFAIFMLVDKVYGVMKFAKNERTKKSIQHIADLYQRIINGEKIDANVWLEARQTAAACAADAAACAAYAAACAADAAYAADVGAAACAAAYAAAACTRHFAALAKRLIELLREAK